MCAFGRLDYRDRGEKILAGEHRSMCPDIFCSLHSLFNFACACSHRFPHSVVEYALTFPTKKPPKPDASNPVIASRFQIADP